MHRLGVGSNVLRGAVHNLHGCLPYPCCPVLANISSHAVAVDLAWRHAVAPFQLAAPASTTAFPDKATSQTPAQAVELALRIAALLSSILVQVWVNDVSALNYGEMVACLMSLDKQRFIRALRWSFTLAVIETFWWEVMWGMMREVGRHIGRNIQDDLLDLEPPLRDAVVLALPFQPLCREDCPGLCPDCGARLADEPEHSHEDKIDPRWAALTQLTEDPDQAE